MGDKSTFLFARPSFIEGVGRVLDLGATMQEYNTSLTTEQADAIAMSADWAAINEDMEAVAAMPHKKMKELASNGK